MAPAPGEHGLQDASQRVEQAVATEGLMSVHTEEASLEDIFVMFAGRGLTA